MYVRVEKRWAYRLLHPKTVTIIVTKAPGGRLNAMAASWVIPTSVNPPLIAVAVSPKRYTFELLQKEREFTVNIPSVDMKDLVELVGSVSGRDVDKFSEGRIETFPAEEIGVPCIRGSLGCIEARVWAMYPAGDHFIVVGKVLNARAMGDKFRDNMFVLEKAFVLMHLGGRHYAYPKEVA